MHRAVSNCTVLSFDGVFDRNIARVVGVPYVGPKE